MASWAPRCSGAGVLGVIGVQPPHQRATDRDRATAREQQEPGVAGVGAVPECVRHGYRPQRVGRPVHRVEGSYPKPAAQQTGYHDHREHVEGERPQPEPERPVGVQERHDEVDESKLRVGVEEQQRDVQDDEERSNQRNEAMDIGDGESRQHHERTPRPRGDAQEKRYSHESERRDTRASAQCPQRLVDHRRTPLPSAGHPQMVWTFCSLSTSRAGMPSARIQSSAGQPRMIAAVLTVLAAKQVCAAALTVRHTGSADHPVRGSRMWWTTSLSHRQRRWIVLDVASAAPDGSATEPAGSSASSWTKTCQPPSGAGPAVAMSPPRLMSTPLPVAWCARWAQRSAAMALAVAPTSSRIPGGTVTMRSRSVIMFQLAGILIDALTR